MLARFATALVFVVCIHGWAWSADEAAEPKVDAHAHDHDHGDDHDHNHDGKPDHAAHEHEDHAHGDHDHGDHGHEIGHANASPGLMKPEEFKSDLALWTFAVFALLLAILWKFAWGPIALALEQREHTIHEHLASAERSHEEAKAMLAEYQRKLDSAADQVREMLEEARRDAEGTKQQILAEAKSGADAERQRALREIDAATDAAIKSIAEKSANLAVDLAGKIVGQKLNASDHSRLISESVNSFAQSSPSRN